MSDFEKNPGEGEAMQAPEHGMQRPADDTAPEKLFSDDPFSDDLFSEETASEETASEETAFEEPVPEESAPEESVFDESGPEEPDPAPAHRIPNSSLPPPPTTPPTYRWDYTAQSSRSTAGTIRRSRGLVAFAFILATVFLVSFAILVASLLVGRGETPTIQRPGVTTDHDDGNTDLAIDGVEQAKHYTVVIEVKTDAGGGTGTGIVMTADGYIATNHHVIEGAEEVLVTFYDGTAMEAEVIGSSEMDDLAVIKVKRYDLTPAVFARSSDCYVGETVYAIGTPGGPEFSWTTTRGIVSYKDREIRIYDEVDGTLQKKLRLIQTDANVNPGNSGGPLINTKGEVLGVVSMKLAEGYEGIGFAIPSDGAVEILEAIMKDGNADNVNSSVSHKRPMLGIVCVTVERGRYYTFVGDRIKELTPAEAAGYSADDLIYPDVSGVLVREITEGMDSVGKIFPGDIITAIQGEQTLTGEALSAIINDYYAGDTVTITVYRDGRYRPVDIVLSPFPD